MIFLVRHFTWRHWQLWLLSFCCSCAWGQTVHSKRGATAHALPARSLEAVTERYAAKLDSLQWAERRGREDSCAHSTPYMITLVGLPAPYDAPLQRIFIPQYGACATNDGALSGAEWQRISLADLYLLNACIQHPELSVNIPPTNDGLKLKEDDIAPITPELTLADRYAANKEDAKISAPELPDDDLGIVVRKPNFWTFKTNFSLQFTQNYVSDNWYKGGESHNALLASTVIEANFNNQRKLTFDNRLEMKLGFQTSHNDEEHKYKTNSDLLRITNKLGLRAIKHWYYTIMLQSWTQFYKGYKSNDPKVYSDFMSPFESLLSIGMDYQQATRNNRFRISATLSPLALKLKYVNRPSLITNFGLTAPHHCKWEYGSNVTVNYTWNIVKNISWAGRIYYFTDYSLTQIEWENTFNLSINRYLSARVFLYPRFDDSRTRGKGQPDFEFNELLSLGLNLNF